MEDKMSFSQVHGDHMQQLAEDLDEYRRVHKYKDAKEHLADAAREAARLRPRDPEGHFVTDEEAGIDPEDQGSHVTYAFQPAVHHVGEEEDRRHEFHPSQHPRDAHGHFVSKQEVEEATKLDAYIAAKHHMADAAREVARLRPRRPDGHFISEQDAGIDEIDEYSR